MSKRAATDNDVSAFMAAVFPGFDALATAAFDEGHVLRTATESLASLRADVARLAGELAVALKYDAEARLYYETVALVADAEVRREREGKHD